MRSRRWVLGVLAVVMLISVGVVPGIVGAIRQEKTYGPSPALAIGELVGAKGRTSCIEITGITPPAHHDWLGRIWQDEFLMWDDVKIVERWNGTWNHGMSGPMKIGDEICAVPKYHVWVYEPEDKIFLTMA